MLAPDSFTHGLGIAPLASTVPPIFQSTVQSCLLPLAQAFASDKIAVNGNFPFT